MKFDSTLPTNSGPPTAGGGGGVATCRVAVTSGNVTISAPGAALDGVTMAASDKVLLTRQTTGSQNGLWTFTGSGSAMTRTSDTITAGMLVAITEGTSLEKVFILATDGTIVVDTTTLTFRKVGNLTGYLATQAGLS